LYNVTLIYWEGGRAKGEDGREKGEGGREILGKLFIGLNLPKNSFMNNMWFRI